MGTNEYSQPASKSSWDSQDFGDVKMVVKMAHFYKSFRPQWVKSGGLKSKQARAANFEHSSAKNKIKSESEGDSDSETKKEDE